jgi:hypothetical protein
MGHLIYGVAPAIELDDWGLRHLQAVMIARLRRNESFSFSWEGVPSTGAAEPVDDSGLFGTVWVSQASSLYFSYDGPPPRQLNGAWLQVLSTAANSNAGLRLLPEPE